ncbi:carboxypeptidase-like regulatory domain-containing protein [Reichenbachiella ulvae]|uniref:Carboxypeptidase-like regulatory domain-containing protein n=1 Tax=Reichenbachiella ulvae TaxID=2980104 RepID=A0ABT3CZH0_9BACT|nr:carboxypeptidase-like regulatory domain-containing protein [Reichenbachiella ulvae]MCV9389091.1 carboxypeptidase-like regulatory domain-containing protein [Reichenbachiella ulvae]
MPFKIYFFKTATITMALLLWSCDCHRHAEGVVLDAQTQLPIAEVQIVNDRDFEEGITSQLILTDSTGYFEYSDISGGLFGCPDLVLVFSKRGYKIHRLNLSENNGYQIDTVFLEQ